MFNNDSQSKNWTVWSESYLRLPLQVTFPDSASAGRIAVKNSLGSLLQGLMVKSSNGTILVNEQDGSLPIVANMNLLIDSSIDFINSNGLMYFGKDVDQENSALGSALTVPVGAVRPTNSSGLGLPSQDFFRCQALASRISILATQASAPTATGVGTIHTQSFVSYIPLKFIHSFFRVLDFPIPNLNLRLTFNISGCGTFASQYMPWSTHARPAHKAFKYADGAVDAVAAGTQPVITRTDISQQVVDRRGANHTPMLFLKTITWSGKDGMAAAARLVEDKKTLTYTVSDYYKTNQFSSGSSITWPIVNGVVRPTRLWVFPLPVDTLTKTDNAFPASIGPNYLQNTQIMLNGNAFYTNKFDNQYQLYKEFETQLIGAGSSKSISTPISYNDFLCGVNPYVFDLSRNPTVQSDTSCIIVLKSDVLVSATAAKIATAFDLTAVIERLQTMTLKIKDGGVEVLVKEGSDSSALA